MKAASLLTLLLILQSASAIAAPSLNLEYGPDPLQKLDVYPVSGTGHPVVIFVHGGSWTSGDKGNLVKNPNLSSFFEKRGIVLVAPNFRLMPSVTYKEQTQDVAAAVAWVQRYIGKYGGDPTSIVLFGYSSGAHLVALAATDPAYIKPGTLRGVACFDVIAYDIPRAIATAAEFGHAVTSERLPGFFGTDRQVQEDASPVFHLSANRTLPSFLVVYAVQQGQVKQRLSEDQSTHFVKALRRNGAAAEVKGFPGSHTALIMGFGRPGHPPTEWMQAFLTRCLDTR